MLTGLTLGMAAAFVWSLTNLIDKHLTNRHAEDGNVSGILILSAFFPAVLLPISLYFTPISAPPREVIFLMTAGGLMVGWLYFYLKALVEDDTSVVVTLLILAPFFSLIFSNIILGETLTKQQLLGGGIMILGALIITYTPKLGTFKFKLLMYAVAACTIMGLMHTLFKFSTFEEVFWRSVFWRSLGMVVVGLFLYLVFSDIRKRFNAFIRNYARSGISLNASNESLTLLGDTIFGFAMLLAPLAIVQTTEAYQPVFIIIITAILAKLGFTAVTEDNSKQALIQKIIGILTVFVGSLILVLNS
jgi:uncharacterized membrane protein